MTKFQVVYDDFFEKIIEDGDFFFYYSLTEQESLQLANDRAEKYLYQAISKFWQRCEPDQIDIYDFDRDMKEFNFDLSNVEIDLLSSLMVEMYFKAHKAKLRAFSLNFTPTDLQVFSPANERKTFLEMYQDIKVENSIMLDNYSGKDRETGASIAIDYNSYESYFSEDGS